MTKSNKKRNVEFWKTKDIIAEVESGKIDLDTEYQREMIWAKDKKSLLIDSILHDIDIPKIYLAFFPKDNHYECIDGKQRIASILEFYDKKLKTSSGEYITELRDDKDFFDYEFSVSIITNPRDEDISTLFYRLNLGDLLNGGERIHAMRGDMRNFIFNTIGENGPFIGKVGMRSYRFSRETALAQMLINSIFFRERDSFVRARYEDLFEFLKKDENKSFSKEVVQKVKKMEDILKEIEKVFGENISRLSRKSAIVSLYLFCEEIIVNDKGKNLSDFPIFYLQLLGEMKEQADLIKNYKEPTKKVLLEKFQKNLQQASVEGYSIQRRHEFLRDAFEHYLKTGKIIGDTNS